MPTGRKRAEFYMRRDFTEHIVTQQERNQLNTVRLIKSIGRGLRLIDTFDMSRREIALRKALFLSRRSAKLADAAIDATIHIREFEKMDPKDRAVFWDKAYEEGITILSKKPEIRGDNGLVKQLDFLQRFFSLPKRIYEERERYWKIIENIVRKPIGEHPDLESGYLQRLDKLVKKAGEPSANIKVIAMNVCVVSSIYADINERVGKGWSEAYQRGMEMAYGKIKGIPELVDAIAAL